jgi:hypothetical protein
VAPWGAGLIIERNLPRRSKAHQYGRPPYVILSNKKYDSSSLAAGLIILEIDWGEEVSDRYLLPFSLQSD